jgi:hypothetical protein
MGAANVRLPPSLADPGEVGERPEWGKSCRSSAVATTAACFELLGAALAATCAS